MTQLIHLERLNQARALAQKGLDSLGNKAARITTNYKTTNNKTTNNKTTKSFVPGENDGGISPVVTQASHADGVSPVGLSKGSYVGSAAQDLVGIRVQISESGRNTYKAYITFQTQAQADSEQHYKLTAFLTNRRRDFVRELAGPTSELALDHLDHEPELSYIGHCHPRGQKQIIPGLAAVMQFIDVNTLIFTLWYERTRYDMQVTNATLTPKQRAAGMQMQAEWGTIFRCSRVDLPLQQALDTLCLHNGKPRVSLEVWQKQHK